MAGLIDQKIEELNKNNFIENTDTICQLIELMRSVDITSLEAQLNATSISDGNGGRIFL